jgi:hypothetical protein
MHVFQPPLARLNETWMAGINPGHGVFVAVLEEV